MEEETCPPLAIDKDSDEQPTKSDSYLKDLLSGKSKKITNLEGKKVVSLPKCKNKTKKSTILPSRKRNDSSKKTKAQLKEEKLRNEKNKQQTPHHGDENNLLPKKRKHKRTSSSPPQKKKKNNTTPTENKKRKRNDTFPIEESPPKKIQKRVHDDDDDDDLEKRLRSFMKKKCTCSNSKEIKGILEEIKRYNNTAIKKKSQILLDDIMKDQEIEKQEKLKEEKITTEKDYLIRMTNNDTESQQEKNFVEAQLIRGGESGDTLLKEITRSADEVSKFFSGFVKRGQSTDFHPWSETNKKSKAKTPEDNYDRTLDVVEPSLCSDDGSELSLSQTFRTECIAMALADTRTYWDAISKYEANRTDEEALKDSQDPMLLDPSIIPKLLVPAYGPVKQCILQENCFLHTKFKNSKGEPAHIGSTFVSEITLEEIENGVVEEIMAGPCFVCISVIIEQSIYQAMATGKMPSPVRTADSSFEVLADLKKKEDDKEPENGILMPWKVPVEIPGGYRKEVLVNNGTGFVGDVIVPFRRICVSDFIYTTEEMSFVDPMTHEIETLVLPTFKEKEALFFRASSSDVNPSSMDPFVFENITQKIPTNESLLRGLFSNEIYAEKILEKIHGNSKLVFAKEVKEARRKTKKRGIQKKYRGSLGKDDWESQRKKRLSFDFLQGRPFEKIFCGIKETCANIRSLFECFNYTEDLTKYDYAGKSINYPKFKIHQRPTLPMEHVSGREIYHSLHIRVNVALSIIDCCSGDLKKNDLNLLHKFIGSHSKLAYYFETERIKENPLFDADISLSKIHHNHTEVVIGGISVKISSTKTLLHELMTTSDITWTKEYMMKTKISHELIYKKSPHETIREYLTDQYSNLIQNNNGFSSVIIKKISMVIGWKYEKVCEHLIFGNFRDTVEIIKNDMSFQCLSSISSILENFKKYCPNEIFRDLMKEEPRIFSELMSVLSAILLRVNAAEMILEEMKNYGGVGVEYEIQLFTQTHIRLARFMEERQFFTDFSIFNANTLFYLPHDHLIPQPFVLYYPGLYAFEHEGAMPDLTHRCWKIPFLWKPPFIGKETDNIGLWEYSCAKLCPKCCLSRSKSQKHQVSLENSEEYFQYTALCFRISLMGLYKHCKNRVSFANRMKIAENLEFYIPLPNLISADQTTRSLRYRKLHEQRDKSKRIAFSKFMKDYSPICDTVRREAMLFYIKHDIALDNTLKDIFSGWSDFVENTSNCAEILRSSFFNEFCPLKGICSSISEKMERKSKVYRNNSPNFIHFLGRELSRSTAQFEKLTVKYLKFHASLMAEDVNAINRITNHHKFQEQQLSKKQIEQQPLIPLDGTFPEKKRKLIEKEKTKFALAVISMKPHEVLYIKRLVSCLVPCDDYDIRIAFFCGITVKSMNVLLEMKRLFESNASINEIQAKIIQLDPIDYDKIVLLFSCLYSHCNLRLIKLPKYIHEKQLFAIRKKYYLENFNPVPEHLRTALLCKCCKAIRGFVAQQSKGEVNFGNSLKVVECEITGDVFCVKKPTSANRKNNPLPLPPPPPPHHKTIRISSLKVPTNSVITLKKEQENNILQILKDERKHRACVFGTSDPLFKKRHQGICRETPLCKIPLVGFAFEYEAGMSKERNKTYTMCPRCAIITEFNINMWGLNGFTCCSCDIIERERINLPSCLCCNAVKQQQKKDKPTSSDSWKTIVCFEDRFGYLPVLKKFHVCHTCKKSTLDKLGETYQGPRSILMFCKKVTKVNNPTESLLYSAFNMTNTKNIPSLNVTRKNNRTRRILHPK